MTSHSNTSNPDDLLTRGTETIECPNCSKPSPAKRVGAQDYCDIYVCNDEHLTRIKIGAARKEWDELAQGNLRPAQGTRES